MIVLLGVACWQRCPGLNHVIFRIPGFEGSHEGAGGMVRFSWFRGWLGQKESTHFTGSFMETKPHSLPKQTLRNRRNRASEATMF